jgi:ubiquinone/menaquinone biosynthesis C-methylase UbiE
MDWWLEELSFAGDEHLDPAFVEAFDRKQGHPDPTPDIEALLAHGVGTGSTVVDLAAGTGQFALAAARHFDRVVAVDVSPAMVDLLHRRTAGMSNVDVQRAGFLSFSYAGADAVHTRHGLHQLPDFWKAVALRRIAGMLRPGGILRVRDLIYDFAPDEVEDVFADWFANAATDPALGYTAQDYARHIRDEHSTFRWLFEPMLHAVGFEILDVAYHARVFGTYTCRLTSRASSRQ